MGEVRLGHNSINSHNHSHHHDQARGLRRFHSIAHRAGHWLEGRNRRHLLAGIDLPKALAAARAVFGKEFNGALSLKALGYFKDGDLPSLSLATQNKLRAAAVAVNLTELPLMVGKIGLSREGRQR